VCVMSHPQGSQSTMHRYKLRSTSASAPSPTLEEEPAENKTGGSDNSDMECATVRASTSSDDPPSKKPKLRRKTKSSLSKKSPFIPIGLVQVAVIEPIEVDSVFSQTGITSLPEEMLVRICQYCDSASMFNLLITSKWFYQILGGSNSFWKVVCTKEELVGYSCINTANNEEEEANPNREEKIGWTGKPMRVRPPAEYPPWRKVFARGLHMRRNIWQSNYEGYRIYANTNTPVVKLDPELDMNHVKSQMGNFPKLSDNDDLKYDWDDKHLVVFHFFRGETESCTIRLWDISEVPQFKYAVERGLECITDKVAVVNNHVAIVPSWPLEANAIVMTLNIEDNMSEVGKFIFHQPHRRDAIDEQWEHTQLRVIRNEAMVVCRCPDWTLIVVELPSCNALYEVSLSQVDTIFDCHQIRSYRQTAMIMFARKQNDTKNILVTVDVAGENTKVRSSYNCQDVGDVALFTDPEEFYIMKRSGNVVMYDASTKTETVKIANENPHPPALQAALQAAEAPPGDGNGGNAAANAPANQQQQQPQQQQQYEYQLFVNRKEQICVMQSASEVPQGRTIKVYTYSQEKLYTINLDLCKYGMSRDESICIYTNGAFLAAADSKKFSIFNVRTGKYHGSITIPQHLERSKGKEEKDCMYEQTGLSLFIFDEDKLIAVHDYERAFPAVLDIYKFW